VVEVGKQEGKDVVGAAAAGQAENQQYLEQMYPVRTSDIHFRESKDREVEMALEVHL